jgi:hypothetical protein
MNSGQGEIMRDILKGLLFGAAIGVPWLIVQLLIGV